MSDRSREGSRSRKNADPDKGPRMIEGAQPFDKGYDSDNEMIDPPGQYPDDGERGNRYMKMQNEIVKRDSTKLKREKFSKIA